MIKVKKIKPKSPKLVSAWKARLQLWKKGRRLLSKSNTLWEESIKLQTKSNKLQAKGTQLQVEGNRLWINTILESYGNAKVEWKNYDYEKQDYECHLETGEVFRP